MEESKCYGEMESETICTVMLFLRHVAYLIKNRAKARDKLLNMSEIRTGKYRRQGGDCISYIRFTGKGYKETGRITDYFRGDRDGTTIV